MRICHSKIFFCQERIGQHEKPFRIIKFRTMRDLRDESGQFLPDEARTTRLGRWLRKYSLDELPQIINVIRGDMNLIGPRPLLPEYLPLYNDKQRKRHLVKPGITGLAQIRGRQLDWQIRLALDVWYVEHRTFRLDCYILWRTFLKLLRHNDGDSPSEKFKGNPH